MRLSLVEKIGVLIIVALIALALRFLWLNPSQMGDLVLYGAYWLLLILTVAFGWHLYRTDLRSGIKRWLSQQGWMLLILAGLLVCALIHERFLFKINYDEHVLMSISRSMHYGHIAGWQADGRIFFGSMTGVSFLPDKRPVFHPFLLSLLHNFTGYRLANAFVLNGLLAGVALLGVYKLGWNLGGRWGGLLFAALLAGVPLFAQNATSGGFDLLNMTLIIALSVAVWHYFKSPEVGNLGIIAFISIFLANTRYESVLYAVVPFLCLGVIWIKDRSRVDLPWVMIFSPIAILPALLANGVFTSKEAFFQMSRSEFWNYKNYGPNLEHGVAYLFDPDRGGTNSLLLALFGILSLIVLPLLIRRELATRKSISPGGLTLIVVGSILLCNVVVILGLGWGKWDDVLVSRFTLPLWFLLAWSVTHTTSTLLPEVRLAQGLKIACAIAITYVVVFSVADASSGRATNKFKPAFLLARSIEFIKQYDPWRQALIIGGSALPYLNEGYPAISFTSADKIVPAVNFKLYEKVVVVLHYKRDSSTGAWMGDASMIPFEGASFEMLKEFQLDPFNRIVIAKVLSLPAEKTPKWVPSTEDESPEAYARRIYRMLP